MPKNWYAFKNLSETEAELFIYDEIGGWGITAQALISELKDYAGRALTVRINSPGGSITEGSAIYNALRRHDGGVTSQIDGYAASMASYIALAGKKVKMAENGYFVIHNPSGGAFGEEKDMRKMADILSKMKLTLMSAYAAKSGKDIEEIERLMDEETWYNGAEAMEAGFVDEVTDRVDAAAHFDFSKFKHPPRGLVDRKENGMADNAVSLEKQITDLTAARDAAQAQAQKNFADCQAMTKERDDLKAKLDTAETNLSTAEKARDEFKASAEKVGTEFTAYKDGEEARISAAVTRAQGAIGQPPVAVGVDNAPNASGASTESSKLTGLERATAAHKANYSRN